MKRIVCFGDSNTWGYKAITGERYSEEERWPCLLQKMLGPGYKVEEEGLNGRTTVFDDPVEEHRNGADYIECCMDTNAPIDMLIIMLGSNDLKRHLGNTPFFIARGMELLVRKAQKSGCGRDGKAPDILVVSPIEVGKNIADCETHHYLDGSAVGSSRELKNHYAALASDCGCFFMAASDYASPCKEDALHLDTAGHKALASAFCAKIKEIYES
jgi:lysophospholipase L1-like esterase